jgi:hypothetical protein
MTDSIPFTPEQDLMLDMIAQAIVRRGMSVPAVFFMQTLKPLNFIGSQALVFFGPVIESIFPKNGIYDFAELMENRDNVDRLMAKIEALESKKDENAVDKKTANKKFFGKNKVKEK